jgi:hypothetical protein
MPQKLIPALPKALCAAAILATLWPAVAQSQSLKPGLWEQKLTMKSTSGDMEKQMAAFQAEMAKLPPEQRKMAEQMMAQQGMQMGSMGGGGVPTVVKICLSPQQAAQLDIGTAEKGCTQKVTQRGTSNFKASFSCSGPPPSSGESEITLQGNSGYTGRSVVTIQEKGKPERVTMDLSGRWLSADCGTLKPIQR